MTNKEEIEALKKRLAELENRQGLVVYIPQPYPVYVQPQPYFHPQPYFYVTSQPTGLYSNTASNVMISEGNRG